MNQWPDNPLPEHGTPAQPAGLPAHAESAADADAQAAAGQAATGLSNRSRLGLALGWGLAVVALAALGWMWRSHMRQHDQMAQNLARLGAQTRDLTLQLQLATQHSEQMRARAALLEEKMAALDAQRTQADAVLQALAQSQQSLMLADMRTALQTAQQQVQLTGNTQPLLQALTDAEQRLAAQRLPRLAAAHQAIVQDLARIKAAHAMDVMQLVADLDGLLQRLDTLPLQGNSMPALQAAPAAKPVVIEPQSRWLRLWQSVKESMVQLVRVRTISSTSAALIAPEQAVYVREHMRQRLLQARMALLVRQPAAAQRDLDAANTLFDQYLDQQSPAVQSAQQVLQQVMQHARESELPAIAQTLQALAAASEPAVAALPVAAASGGASAAASAAVPSAAVPASAATSR